LKKKKEKKKKEGEKKEGDKCRAVNLAVRSMNDR
jgi:hypothetical protein